MALKVGSIYIEAFLKQDELASGTEKARKHFRDLQGAAKGTAASVEAANTRITKSFQQLQSQLAGIDPFARFTATAAAAYDAIVGRSIIPDLRKDVVAEVNKLRDQLTAARAFDPLTTQAAEAAAAAHDELEDLVAQQKGLQETLEHLGIKRPNLDTFFDDEGRIRDAIQTTDATFEESQRKHLRGTGGRTKSTTAQDTRIEGLVANADDGTRLASAEDINAAKELAEEARNLYGDLDQVNRRMADLRALTDAAGKGSVALGRTFRTAQEALDEYTAASARSTQSLQQLAASSTRLDQLSRRYDALSDAANKAAAGSAREAQALRLTDRASDQYSAELTRQTRLEQLSAQADLARAAALDRVRTAQVELNQATAAAPRRAATPAQERTSTSTLEKQAQIEEQRRLRGIEQEKKAEADRANEELRHRNQVTEIQQRNIGTLRAAEIETASDVEKARLQSASAVETAEKQRLARTYEADQKVEAQKVRGAGKLVEVQQRGEQTRLTLAQQIEGKLQQIREVGAQRMQAIMSRSANQQQRDADKALKAQQGAAQRGTGLSAEENSLIKRYQAEKKYQEALAITKKRLDETNLSETQRNNLLALSAKLQDRATAAQKGGSGLLNVATAGFKSLAGALGIATLGYMAFAFAGRTVKDSLDIAAQTEYQRKSLGALIGSQDRANRSWDDAVQFANRYKFTLREMSETLTAIAPLIRTSTTETEKQLEVLARLTTRQPSQGIAGAAFALGELQAGDTQSLKERFNIPISLANKMKREILAGADAFLVLDKYLNQLGNTEAVLQQRTTGLIGAQNALRTSWVALKAEGGDLGSTGASIFLNTMASVLDATTQGIAKVRDFNREIADLENKRRGRSGSDTATAFDFVMQNPEVIGRLAPMILGLSKGLDQIDTTTDAAGRSLARLSDEVTVATNRLDQGKLSSAAYAAELKRIRQEASLPVAINTGGSMGQVQSLDMLQQRLTELQTQMRQKPEFAQQFLPEAEQVAAKIAELKRMSPIDITVEMRLQFLGDASSIMQETLSRTQQMRDQLQNLDSGHADRLSGITDQAGTIWRDYLRNKADANVDYMRQQATAESRFNNQQATESTRFYHNAADARGRFHAQYNAAERDFYANAGRDLQRFNAQQSQEYGDFYRNAGRDLQRFNESQAQAVSDFQRSAARSRRSFNRSEAQAVEDYRRGLARAERDQRVADAQVEEDHARTITGIREAMGEKLVEIERTTRRQMQDAQREFDIGRSRDTEDFELERRRLLAEGKVAEAQVMQSRFEKEQRRKAEDLARRRSEIGDSGATATAETGTDAESQIADAQANFERDRERQRKQREVAAADQEQDFERGQQRARAQFEEQAAEAAADFAEQQERARAAFAQQQADAEAAFALQQERARANFAQQQADAETAFAAQQLAATNNFNQQQIDAEDAFLQQQSDAKANFTQQQKDADDAHTEALRKMEASWREQFLELVKQRKTEIETYAAAHKTILDGYDQFLKDQETRLDQARQNIIDVQRLVGEGMTTQQAELAIKLREGQKEFTTLLGEMERELGPAGTKAATSYMREFAKALLFGATETDKALQNMADSLVPQSPIKRGPLKNHEAGARRAGAMYTRGFAAGMADPRLLQSLLSVRETLTRPVATSDMRALATGRGGGGGGGNRPIVIQIMAPVTMDGRTVGQLVAPHVAGIFDQDLEVSAQMIESVYTPGVHQQAFRRPG